MDALQDIGTGGVGQVSTYPEDSLRESVRHRGIWARLHTATAKRGICLPYVRAGECLREEKTAAVPSTELEARRADLGDM